MGRKKKYLTEEDRKAAQRETVKRYGKRRYQNNKEKILSQNSEYRSTPIGRATYLLSAYRKNDKKYNRGECTLTAEWILEHIFSGQCCTHCGESDWHKLGCNRLDNSKPHTPENVEPCCKKCNDRLQAIDLSKIVLQYTLDGELLREWESANECGRNGYETSSVASCCRGVRKTHKGYIWRYKEEVA